MRRAAIALAFLLAIPTAAASLEARYTTWLVLDPDYDNRLVVEMPLGVVGPDTRTSPLEGGVLATVVVDPVKLLFNQPTVADVEIEEIRIAAGAFRLAPHKQSTSTGTMCVTKDPAKESYGTIELPILSPPVIESTLASQSTLLGPLGDLLPDGRITFSSHFREEVGADLRTFLASGLTSGPISVEATAEGELPEHILALGGQPFELHLKILSSLTPPQEDPLLSECRAAGIH